ncbi:MAG: hypothetical protein KDN22_24730 [Verrucomicrobiae bacterium]|nr:hypothetical protein [Verrucomicrobiae bacterium]
MKSNRNTIIAIITVTSTCALVTFFRGKTIDSVENEMVLPSPLTNFAANDIRVPERPVREAVRASTDHNPSPPLSPTKFAPGGIFGSDGVLTHAALESFGVPMSVARDLQDAIDACRGNLALEARSHTAVIDYKRVVDVIPDEGTKLVAGPSGSRWMTNADVVYQIAPFDQSEILEDFSQVLNGLLGEDLTNDLLPLISKSPPFSLLGKYEVVVGFSEHPRPGYTPTTMAQYEIRSGGQIEGSGTMNFESFSRRFGVVFDIDDAGAVAESSDLESK